MKTATILILATLDTKGPEAQYLRELVESRGDRAVVIDTGVAGEPQARAEISREDVAQAGGRRSTSCESISRAKRPRR